MHLHNLLLSDDLYHIAKLLSGNANQHLRHVPGQRARSVPEYFGVSAELVQVQQVLLCTRALIQPDGACSLAVLSNFSMKEVQDPELDLDARSLLACGPDRNCYIHSVLPDLLAYQLFNSCVRFDQKCDNRRTTGFASTGT